MKENLNADPLRYIKLGYLLQVSYWPLNNNQCWYTEMKHIYNHDKSQASYKAVYLSTNITVELDTQFQS